MANCGRIPISIRRGSAFANSIYEIFDSIRPTKIIETGTYLGTGSTTIIAQTIKSLSIDALFYTIEINPTHYALAKDYFSKNKLDVIAFNGLSIPRSMLPSIKEITKTTIEDVKYNNIFVDHHHSVRSQLYYDETNFPNVPDNLLGTCLKLFDFTPEFVLLDSAGHVGNIEFNYLIKHLNASCYIALDDICHIKHNKSFMQLQADHRFELITMSSERYGFCIVKFTPFHADKIIME